MESITRSYFCKGGRDCYHHNLALPTHGMGQVVLSSPSAATMQHMRDFYTEITFHFENLLIPFIGHIY
jgi:hypothetical protein